jgi:hypothetical protein
MISNRIARLGPNGATNTSFSPGAGLNAEGLCVNLDASGRVIAGGGFNMVDGFLQANLAIFEEDGELIGSTPTPSAAVRTIATQAGGEILFGGDFTSVSGTPRDRIARITPDLTLEAGFNPNASAPVYALALQTDGEILAGGNFTIMGGLVRNRVARLFNGLAPNRLYAVSASLIKWDRIGTSQKTQRVTFEIDTGSGYGPLAGTISQISTGWQIIPSTPLSGATNNVRATAFPSDSHSSGTHQIIASFPVLPEIGVKINNEEMTDGISTVTFPTLQVGQTARVTVTITNTGLATLTLEPLLPGELPVTIFGQWEIESQPNASIPPNTSVSFDILFKPTDKGDKLGTLSIGSNDANENPFTVNLSGGATAGPGGLDLSWQPSANDIVLALAKSSNNKVWLAGNFTTVRNVARSTLALVDIPLADENGNIKEVTVQKQVANMIPKGIYNQCVVQLPDGTVLVGGSNTTKLYWVGFSPNGEVILKNSFSIATFAGYPAGTNIISCMAVEADGSVLVGGFFGRITVGNVSGVGPLIRIHFRPDPKGVIVASIDESFFPTSLAYAEILSIAIQADGKILLGARYINGVIRITPKGALDETFSIKGPVKYNGSVTLDSQERVLIRGNLGVNRFSPSGDLDTTFLPIDAYYSHCFLTMADGTIVVSGTGVEEPGYPSSFSLKKFLTNGNADPSFVSSITGPVVTVCSQDNGALLIGGDFTAESIPLTAARITNSPGSTALTVVNATRVQWLRSGALPETQVVVFDVSQDNGASWIRFGQGKRIAGGWELTDINLPFSGILRARAYIQSGGNSSIMENQVSFSGLEVSDLIVQVPGESIVADNGQADPVASGVGSTLPVTVTLINTGLAGMKTVDATITPTASTGVDRWTIFAKPNSELPAGGNTTMTVNFSPQNNDKGFISAVLSITSSVPGLKNPYQITLVGAAVTVPDVRTNAVAILPSGNVTFSGTFTPNDLEATAYFRYGLEGTSEDTWLNTAPIPVSGFNPLLKTQVLGDLTIGSPYRVRAYIVNSTNTNAPLSKGFVTFTPQV